MARWACVHAFTCVDWMGENGSGRLVGLLAFDLLHLQTHGTE